MEDVPGHKTFLTLSETTDSFFAALDASTVGKESLPATVFKKPPEFLQRPPVVRSFDFPARRGARPTMVHTAQVGGASSYERPVRETRPGTGPGASYERPVRETRPGTGPGGTRCAHDVYPKFWPVKGTGSLPPMAGGSAAQSACVFEVNKRDSCPRGKNCRFSHQGNVCSMRNWPQAVQDAQRPLRAPPTFGGTAHPWADRSDLGGPRRGLRAGRAPCSPTYNAIALRKTKHMSTFYSKMLRKTGCLHPQALDPPRGIGGSRLIRCATTIVVSAGTARLTSTTSPKGRKHSRFTQTMP